MNSAPWADDKLIFRTKHDRNVFVYKGGDYSASRFFMSDGNLHWKCNCDRIFNLSYFSPFFSKSGRHCEICRIYPTIVASILDKIPDAAEALSDLVSKKGYRDFYGVADFSENQPKEGSVWESGPKRSKPISTRWVHGILWKEFLEEGDDGLALFVWRPDERHLEYVRETLGNRHADAPKLSCDLDFFEKFHCFCHSFSISKDKKTCFPDVKYNGFEPVGSDYYHIDMSPAQNQGYQVYTSNELESEEDFFVVDSIGFIYRAIFFESKKFLAVIPRHMPHFIEMFGDLILRDSVQGMGFKDFGEAAIESEKSMIIHLNKKAIERIKKININDLVDNENLFSLLEMEQAKKNIDMREVAKARSRIGAKKNAEYIDKYVNSGKKDQANETEQTEQPKQTEQTDQSMNTTTVNSVYPLVPAIVVTGNAPTWHAITTDNTSDIGGRQKKENGMMEKIKSELSESTIRIVGSQFVKTSKAPIVALLTRNLSKEDESARAAIAAFLKTDIGEAVLGFLLAGAISSMPSSLSPELASKLARELRIRSMAGAGDLVADAILGPLREIVSDTIKGIDKSALEETTGVRADFNEAEQSHVADTIPINREESARAKVA